ncbi:uncharacterized protein LOC102801745, partial [Saccoglossus kowalevskii]|uniref:Uncharacterized protein LOC102801745 n=1 Tax=Saccoglossus kowalevskii TaxID=10224 RepID=A0ABM0M322_SACKO
MQFCHCSKEPVQLRKYGFWPGSPTKPQVAFDLELMELLRLLQLVQLRKYGFWPGSPTKPQVAFDLELMELLRLLQLECQVSVKAFTEMLKNKCKDIHESFYELKDVYKILIQEAVAEYRFNIFTIQNLKNVCSEFDNGTICPACPSKESGNLVYSIDADFQLVRKRSSGCVYGKAKHEGYFFLPQDKVDIFVESYNLRGVDITTD